MHKLDGVVTPIKPVTPCYWILSRAHYVVRILDFHDVPANKRQSALTLAQAAWTPFVDTAHYVIEVDDGAASHVMLYAWDREAVVSAQTLAGVEPDQVITLPEAALRVFKAVHDISNNQNASPEIGTAGATLTEALDGVVGNVMVNGSIVAEQWWSVIPPPATWANFLRSAGLSADANAAATLTAAPALNWRNAPIGYAGGAAPNTTSRREWWVLAIAAWLLMLPTVWLGNEWRQLNALKKSATEQLAITERELAATLSARGQAMNNLDRANKLAQLFDEPEPLALFATVNDVLSQNAQGGTLQISEWDMRGADIRVVLVAATSSMVAAGSASSAGSPAATVLVKAFEKIPTLRDVEVNVDGTRTTLKMRVVPTALPSSVADEPVAQPSTSVDKKPVAAK